jgi:hypothetical protein
MYGCNDGKGKYGVAIYLRTKNSRRNVRKYPGLQLARIAIFYTDANRGGGLSRLPPFSFDLNLDFNTPGVSMLLQYSSQERVSQKAFSGSMFVDVFSSFLR